LPGGREPIAEGDRFILSQELLGHAFAQ
jgi:hypothetical protein